MMRRLLTALALAVGLTVTAPTPAGAHTWSQQTIDICYWWKNYYFGAYSPGIQIVGSAEVHWWGSHQVLCYYDPIPASGPANWELLYDRISGARAWI